MFSGIVQETGKILSCREASGGKRFVVSCSKELSACLERGSSVSVNGACQTVDMFESNSFSFFSSAETLKRTNFSALRNGKRVNLERSLRPTDFLDGHIVTGHVDGTARLKTADKCGEGYSIELEIPVELLKYVAEKGSLTVDGVSLTVNNVTNNYVGLMIIPVTYQDTALSDLKTGDKVNIEVDILARYLERLLSYTSENNRSSQGLVDKLKNYGYIQREDDYAGLL